MDEFSCKIDQYIKLYCGAVLLFLSSWSFLTSESCQILSGLIILLSLCDNVVLFSDVPCLRISQNKQNHFFDLKLMLLRD